MFFALVTSIGTYFSVCPFVSIEMFLFMTHPRTESALLLHCDKNRYPVVISTPVSTLVSLNLWQSTRVGSGWKSRSSWPGTCLTFPLYALGRLIEWAITALVMRAEIGLRSAINFRNPNPNKAIGEGSLITFISSYDRVYDAGYRFPIGTIRPRRIIRSPHYSLNDDGPLKGSIRFWKTTFKQSHTPIIFIWQSELDSPPEIWGYIISRPRWGY